jgi:CRP/FNR family transcriptional regulator
MKQAEKQFPFLTTISEDDLKQIQWLSVKKGDSLFLDGEDCNYAAFLYEGEVKVSKTGVNGREVNLYRIQPGEACILTITSSLSGQPYPAEAYTEADSKLFLVEKQLLKRWLGQEVLLQNQIYDHMASRFITMMSLFDSLIFSKIEHRIIDFLLQNLNENDSVYQITHEEMAVELGTAREVISRTLKQFENKKLIKLARGKIIMLDRDRFELEFDNNVTV